MSEYNRKWWDNMHGEDRNSHQGGHRNQWWGNKNGEGDKSHHSSNGNKWWEKDKNKEDKNESTTTPTPTGYIESDAVKALRAQMEAQLGLKPGEYVSQWQPQINATLHDILNRKDFQYDLNGDALYQMYKDSYVNLGQKAMMDTMGQAAALTGGYGNSAAQMVGQQAYQNYLQGLTDKIPELYQIALNQYNQAGQDLYQRYGLLNTQEQNAYNQWQDNFNRWLAERDFTTGRYDTERGFDYGTYRDTVSDSQWKEELAIQQQQMQLQREQYEFEKYMAMYEAGMFDSGSSSGGGGGGYSSGGGSSTGDGYGAGFKDAQYLINNAADTKSQENVIKNAAEKGLITKAGADELNKLVGNTQYTK
jgi:hypothetical protein